MNWNKSKAEFIDNLRIDIDNNLIHQIEREIECDIVKAITLGVIKLRESDVYIKDLLDYKIDSYPINEGYYHLGILVEDNVEEIIEIMEKKHIKEYITYCITFNLHQEYLQTKLSYLIEEYNILSDVQQMEEFIEDLLDEEELRLDYNQLSIFQNNTLIDDVIDRYLDKIIEYRLALTEFYLLNGIDYPIITDYIY